MLEELIRKLNEKRVRARGALAEIAGLYGGEGQHPSTQAGLHRVSSENLTNKLGALLPPQLAANVADMGGLANETISGLLQSALGNQFTSETGFDWADIANNRMGQDAALANLEEEPVNPLVNVARDMTGLNAGEALARFLRGKDDKRMMLEKVKKMSPAERMVAVMSAAAGR